MNLKEFFESQAGKIGFDTTRDDYTAMIGASAMSEIEIPDAFVNKYGGNMISFDDAKENPGIKAHFKSQLKANYLGVIDSTLDKVLESEVFTDDEKAEILGGENSKAKFSMLATKLEEKANAKPVVEGNEEQEKILADARKQIKTLNSDILNLKSTHMSEIEAKETEFENRSLKNDLILNISSHKWADNVPGGKDRAINAIAEQMMTDDRFVVRRKADNSLGLFTKDDPEIEYHEDNKEVELKTVLAKEVEPFTVKRSGSVDGNGNPTPSTPQTPVPEKDGSLESSLKSKAQSNLDDVLDQFKN